VARRLAASSVLLSLACWLTTSMSCKSARFEPREFFKMPKIGGTEPQCDIVHAALLQSFIIFINLKI